VPQIQTLSRGIDFIHSFCKEKMSFVTNKNTHWEGDEMRSNESAKRKTCNAGGGKVSYLIN
jgi:hypothetical protein